MDAKPFATQLVGGSEETRVHLHVTSMNGSLEERYFEKRYQGFNEKVGAPFATQLVGASEETCVHLHVTSMNDSSEERYFEKR